MALVEAKAKDETTLLARSFPTRETALKQELACLRRFEKDLSKRLYDRYQEVVELEAKIPPLRIQVFKLEEAAKASKAKMVGLEERSINPEMQWGRVEAELLQQAKRFEEVEVEMTGDAIDATTRGSRTPLLRLPVCTPRWTLHPSR